MKLTRGLLERRLAGGATEAEARELATMSHEARRALGELRALAARVAQGYRFDDEFGPELVTAFGQAVADLEALVLGEEAKPR